MAPASNAISVFRWVTLHIMVPVGMLVYLTASSRGQTQLERLRPLRFDAPKVLSPSQDPNSRIQVDANAFPVVRPTIAADVPAPGPFSARPSEVESTPPQELHRPIQLQPIELDSLETASVFNADPSQPVVMVLLNSDLEGQLLSQEQMQQLLGRIPSRDQTTAAADDTGAVQLASFQQEEKAKSEDKETQVESKSPLEGFQDDLDALKKRYEARKNQIAEDKTLDSATIGELTGQINPANDWIIKASQEIAKYKKEKKKFDEFAGPNGTLQKKQDEQKKLPSTPAAPKAEYLELSKKHLDAVKELADLEMSDPTQRTDLDRRDVRTKTDQLKAKIKALTIKCDEAIEQLSAEVQEKTGLIQTKRDQLQAVRERIAMRDARVTELPRVSNKVGNDLADTKDQIEELRNMPDDNNKTARMLVLESKELALEVEEEAIRLEAKRQDQTGRLYPLEVSILTAEIKRLEPELKTFRGVLKELRDREIEVRERLDKVERNDEVTAQFKVLRDLAEANEDFTGDRSALIDRLEECRIQLVKVYKQNAETESGFNSLKHDIGELEKAASGIRLVEHQRTLVSTGESQMRREQIYDDIQAGKLQALRLKERRDQLSNREDYLANITAMLDAEVAADIKLRDLTDEKREQAFREWESGQTRSRAIEIAGRLVATQEDYVNELIKDYSSYFQELSALDVQHKQLIQNVQKARDYIDQYALWVRSATPVKLEDIATTQDGLVEFFKGQPWKSLVDQVGKRITDRPYDAAILVLFMGTMFVVQRRLRWSHD
jgi:hypothetical protein